MRRNNDILWKMILEDVFDDFLRFIFPKAEKIFDFKRGFQFLDKELAEMYPEPGKGTFTRFVDKLVKVFRRDGKEEWFLIHLEVQGQTSRKAQFSERMFRYFYRIFDHHRKPVTGIAIFTGSDGKRMPNRFEYEFLNSRVLYQYNTLSLVDLADKELEESNNPFAVVALAAKTALLEGKISEVELLKRKVLIARRLFRKGFSKRKIKAIFRFLENYVHFQDSKTNRTFRKRIQLHNKNNVMGMEEYVKMVAREEGLAEGLAEGRAEGLEKANRRTVKNLLKKTDFSVRKIASIAGVSVAFVNKVKSNMKLSKAYA